MNLPEPPRPPENQPPEEQTHWTDRVMKVLGTLVLVVAIGGLALFGLILMTCSSGGHR